MKIRPLHDQIVVRRKEPEKMSTGGIVLAATAKEKPNEGEVIAVGNGKILDNGKRNTPSVKVGDQVIFGRYASSDALTLDDEELIVIKEAHIYGIVEP